MCFIVIWIAITDKHQAMHAVVRRQKNPECHALPSDQNLKKVITLSGGNYSGLMEFGFTPVTKSTKIQQNKPKSPVQGCYLGI